MNTHTHTKTTNKQAERSKRLVWFQSCTDSRIFPLVASRSSCSPKCFIFPKTHPINVLAANMFLSLKSPAMGKPPKHTKSSRIDSGHSSVVCLLQEQTTPLLTSGIPDHSTLLIGCLLYCLLYTQDRAGTQYIPQQHSAKMCFNEWASPPSTYCVRHSASVWFVCTCPPA